MRGCNPSFFSPIAPNIGVNLSPSVVIPPPLASSKFGLFNFAGYYYWRCSLASIQDAIVARHYAEIAMLNRLVISTGSQNERLRLA
jgi:hypothetical protein